MLPPINQKNDSSTSSSSFFPSFPFFRKKTGNEPRMNQITPKENEILKQMHFSTSEKLHLLGLYQEMIGESAAASGSSGFTFTTFASYFQFSSATGYIRRTFELINSKYMTTGYPGFYEFCLFCKAYLVIDQTSIEEFCFRLISRRGSNFLIQYSVLDLEDFVTFVIFKYQNTIKLLPKQRKIALTMFECILNNENDDGINFIKFQNYCRQNPAFLRLTHPIQNHLRKCIFGIEFWVEKSRSIKASQTMNVVTLVLGSNRIAEQYTLHHIEDPVIDEHGYPIKAPKKKKQSSKSITGKSTSTTTATEAVKHEVSREYLAFLEPFTFDKHIENFPLKVDFPEVIHRRGLKKHQKLLEQSNQNQQLKSVSVRTYDLLIQACADLIYHRRDTRRAFEQWIRAVELTRVKKPTTPATTTTTIDGNGNPLNNPPMFVPPERVHHRIVANNQRLFEDREDNIVKRYEEEHFQRGYERNFQISEQDRLQNLMSMIREVQR